MDTIAPLERDVAPAFSFSKPAAQPDPERAAYLAELLATSPATGRVIESVLVPQHPPGWTPTPKQVRAAEREPAWVAMKQKILNSDAKMLAEWQAQSRNPAKRQRDLEREHGAWAPKIAKQLEERAAYRAERARLSRMYAAPPVRRAPRAAARARRTPRVARVASGAAPPSDDPAPGPSPATSARCAGGEA